jgi:hypothetical protein
MDTPTTNPNDTTPAIASERLPCDAELYRLAEDFCVKTLELIPELHGLAIVPIWNHNPEGTPPGLLRLRDPQAPYMASVLRLLSRLAAFNVELQRDLVAQIRVFDNYAAQLAEQIKDYSAQLDTIKQQIDTNTPNG